jgi:hypothetical protein
MDLHQRRKWVRPLYIFKCHYLAFELSGLAWLAKRMSNGTLHQNICSCNTLVGKVNGDDSSTRLPNVNVEVHETPNSKPADRLAGHS